VVDGFDPVILKALSEYGGQLAVIISVFFTGVAVLVTKLLLFIKQVNDSKCDELRIRCEEHKADKDRFAGIVERNTEAMTKVCSAVDHCTQAINRNTVTIQDLLMHRD
jgi:Mg2+/Co2+ transporter CorB